MRVGPGYISKSEQNRFWYDKSLPYDYVFYTVTSKIVTTKIRDHRSWYADRISYSVTKPDLSY